MEQTGSDERGKQRELWWKEGEETIQRTCMNDPRIKKTVWELNVGVGVGGGIGGEG